MRKYSSIIAMAAFLLGIALASAWFLLGPYPLARMLWLLAGLLGGLGWVWWLSQRGLGPSSPSGPDQSYQLFVQHFQGVGYQAILEPLRPLMLWGRVEDLSGYSPQDFLAGRVDFLDLLHPEDLPRLKQALAAMARDPNYSQSMTFRIHHQEGSFRWINAVANRVEDARGRILVQGVMLDVTEQKQAEEALEKSERQLRQITDAVQDIVLLIDEKAIIQYVTPSSTPVIGLRPEDLMGRSAYEILDPEQSKIFEQMAIASTPEAHFAQSGFSYAHPDGRTLVMEAAINFLFDQARVFHGAVAGIRDVTARYQAEQAVRQSEQMLRQITDAMQDIVLLTDRSAIIRYITPSVEKIAGVKPEALIGQSAYSILDPQQSSRFEALSSAATPQNSAAQAEFSFLHPDGRVLLMEASINFLFDDAGHGQGAVVGIRDVTARCQALQAVREREFRLSQITNTMQDVVILLDIEGNIQYVTPSVQSIFGYSPESLVGQSGKILVNPQDLSWMAREGQAALKDRRSYKMEFEGRHQGGHYIWIEAVVNFVWDERDRPSGVVVGLREISDRKQQEAYAEYMAFHDELTKLPNRRALRQHAEEAIIQARSEDTPLALLYLDLDNFKSVNDTLGHDVGDELLIQMAQILSHELRPGDVLARLGGDEFACVLAGTDSAQAAQVAATMVKAIRKTFSLAQQSINLGVSIGIASFPKDGETFVDLLKVADIAMYQAKGSGSLVVAYDASKSPYSEERLQLETHLRQAIEQQSFGLQFQPIWHLREARLEGAEALLYWDRLGQKMPASQFIPLAEELRLVEQLDRVGLRKGLGQLGAWQAQGQKLCLSINLSTQSLEHAEIAQEIEALVEEAGVDARRLILEVTESALLRNPELAREVLTQLGALGIKIAIDDFGSGYASLAYLRQLPMDRIKIDRSFVGQLGADKRDEKLVRAAIDLAHSLEAEVLAEGVETREQLLWLVEHGCDLVQGYLIGQPLPVAAWPSDEAITAKLNLHPSAHRL